VLYRPQYEIIAEKIAQLIIQSHFQPGDRLPTEQQLGEQFGVSRNIVREAIKVLTATGLVGVRKGVGIYVAKEAHPIMRQVADLSILADPQQMDSFFTFRCMQEMMTARLATQQITLAELRQLERIVQENQQGASEGDWDRYLFTDNAFHHTIAEATHNNYFTKIIDSMLGGQAQALVLLKDRLPNTMCASAEQHRLIFEHIKHGNAEAAVNVMKQHIDTILATYHQEIRARIIGDLLPS
jgi:DNA-binding FadR family transcriptional regulator